MKYASTVFGVLAVGAVAAGAEVGLSGKPAVTAERDGVRITFTVTAPTDVEVAIVDVQGNVVRHLAAGVVGKAKAARPLKPGSLDQSLLWDWTNDIGLPAGGWTSARGGRPAAANPSPSQGEGRVRVKRPGAGEARPSPQPSPRRGEGAAAPQFRVRVRTGMRVAFGRTVGGSPYVVGGIRGLATDKDGRLYLMSQSYRSGSGPRYLQVFDREGTYLRTIMPYSADLPRKDVTGFGLIDTGEPNITPRNREGVWPQVYPLRDLHLQPRVSDTSQVIFCDETGLLRIDTRGAAVDGFTPRPIWPAAKPKFHYNRAGPLFAAVSPDGKRLYVAGPYANEESRFTNDAVRKAWPKGRVYVLDLAKAGGARPFVDVPITVDRDLQLTTGARTVRRQPHGPVHGVATDAKGNVYVCDRANDRVAVYDAGGKLVNQIPVRQPHLVAVHNASGEVYVVAVRLLAYRQYAVRLLKFAGRDATKPSAEMVLPETAGQPIMALGTSGDRAVVWLTGVRGSQVWRVEDRAGKLEVVGQLPVASDGALWGSDRIAVDYETDDVYVNDGWSSLARYNGLTGKGGAVGDARALTGVWERDTNQRINLSATDATVGPDGFVYLRNGPRYSGPITRWTRALKPAPLAATGTHVMVKYIYSRYGAGYGERGLDVHPDGRVFVMSMYNWAKYFVHVFGPDGKPLNQGRLKGQVKAYEGRGQVTSGLIGPLTGQCGGLKVDAAGNVYVGMQLHPDGHTPPAGFEKDAAYRGLAGSIFKFQPTGGGLVPATGVAPGTAGIKVGRSFVEGAVAVYPDFAPFSGRYGSGCACRNPRFDLDSYGRLYIPNAVRFSVGVVDNAGNEILRFGRYGNPDDVGSGSSIPLGWPIAVGISKRHIYVSDMLNKRVVRADVSYAAGATVAIPPPPALALASEEKDLLDVVRAGPSPARAAAVESLVAMGPEAIPLIEKSLEAKGPSPTLTMSAARIRAEQVWPQAVALSKTLDKPWLKRALVLALTRQDGLPSVEDARVNLLHLTRLVPAWPAAEVKAVVKKHLADASPRVRLAALWALNRDGIPETAAEIAKTALNDRDERVRVFAAILSFDRGHGDGLAVILAAAQGGDDWALDRARPVAREEILMEGGPKYLKYPVGEREVDLAIGLLNNEYNNMRWVGAGVLMLSGNPRAPKALAERLSREEISMVRRRIILGLKHLRAREGLPPLLANVADGPGSRKKGTGWHAAEALADIGDPNMIQPLIDLLDQPKSKDLALFALSRAFDAAVTTGSGHRLIPDTAKGLVPVSIFELPPPADRKTAWQAWWSVNRGAYRWDAKHHSLRAKGRP